MIRFDKAQYRHQDFTLDMDFSVARNSFTAVLGPSGAGKSTLLNVIAGFEPLAQGSLLIAGEDMAAVPPQSRPASMVFQDNNVFAHLSAFDNVALGIDPGLALDTAGRERVAAALEAVGIAHLAARLPGSMSGGERQRIALARVLVRNRPVLLLDEAFAALGPGLRRDMLQLVQRLHRQLHLTTLMVTHAPEDARAVAASVIFVDAGEVRPPQPLADFFSSSDAAVQRYLGDWT
ncbi:MAG: ATP-binding cassette domain-containing protein [Hyphomicrobiales bacterium]